MKPDTKALAEGAIAEVVELDGQADFADPNTRARIREELEAGNVIFLKNSGFSLTGRERAIITDPKIMFRGNEERSKRNGRPTVTFDVGSDHMLFTRPYPSRRQQQSTAMIPLLVPVSLKAQPISRPRIGPAAM